MRFVVGNRIPTVPESQTGIPRKTCLSKGFAEGQKGGYEKGFEAGRRAGLEVRIDDERFEALDEVQRDSNEEWTSQWMHTTIDTI